MLSITSIDIRQIKLIIWDLDNTFWRGILSEGEVVLNDKNIRLVQSLIDKGIVNSICSKNNFEDAKAKLEKYDLWSCFVFPSIDWSAKAPRIEHLIKTMGLRAANVLFIDDDPVNLNEVRFFLPDIMTLNTAGIDWLAEKIEKLPDSDKSHERLKRYRILETKNREKEKVRTAEKFLRQSDIRVSIRIPVVPDDLDRIEELVLRTNQLNYTKIRSTKEELAAILNDPDYSCRIVSARDKYGDYGTVGFFALNKPTRTLLHFLFSCRTIGMGIEQFIYEHLNFPTLAVTGSVTGQVQKKEIADWIKLDSNTDKKIESDVPETKPSAKVSVLFKGPCDLSTAVSYIKRKNKHIESVCEFNYVDDNGVSITAFNNTTHIVQYQELDKVAIDDILEDVPFYGREAFRTRIFENNWDFIFLSLLPDEHEGIYRHRKTGINICFSSANFDITDKHNWEDLMKNKIPNHGFRFTPEILEDFQNKFEFQGYMQPDDIVRNLSLIRQNLDKDTILVLMLGSEIECDNNTTEFTGHATNNIHVNREIRETFSSSENVIIINYTDYITSSDCYVDSINHFSRQVYHDVAEEVIRIINKRLSVGAKLKLKHEIAIRLQYIKRRLGELKYRLLYRNSI